MENFARAHESLEAMSWPTTPGQVTLSFLKAETIEVSIDRATGFGVRLWKTPIRRSSTTPLKSTAKRSKETESARYAVELNQDRASVEEKLKQYPVGKSVTVSYNPSDPEQCLLEPALGVVSPGCWTVSILDRYRLPHTLCGLESKLPSHYFWSMILRTLPYYLTAHSSLTSQ